MHTLNHKDLSNFINEITIGLHVPTMVWGQPGAGKSAAIHELAARNDAVVCDIRLSQYDSVDLRGIPTIEGRTTVWNLPATMPFVGNDAFPDDRPVYLFLDEINSGAPAVLAVAYQLVLDRGVGEHRLKDNVVVIAAGNREGDKGVTNKMPLPLANRFCHVELAVDPEVVTDHFMGLGLPAECVAFLTFRKPLVSTFDPSRPDKAFATPRSWEQAFRIYASSATTVTKRVAMSGCVGEGPASEFWAFVDSIDKVIPISTILRDPQKAPLPEELSMRYATAVSVSGAMSVEDVKPLHAYLQRMDPEFLILAWQLALKRDGALLSTPEFLDLATKYRALFQR